MRKKGMEGPARKQVSMRLETLMEEVLQRYLQRFGMVYIRFIIPALCETLVLKVRLPASFAGRWGCGALCLSL